MTFDQSIIHSIVQTVADFRENEIASIDSAHVIRWIDQFPVDQSTKSIIIFETDRLLKHYYCSKRKAIDLILAFLMLRRTTSNVTKDWISDINFLQIQRYGESQIKTIEMIDGILSERYGFKTSNCGGSNRFVYVDDCIYSGNRLLNDIIEWIENSAPPGASLIIFCLAAHTRGLEYAHKKITKFAKLKRISIEPPHIGIKINNSMSQNSPVEFLWPKYRVVYDDRTYRYYQTIRDRIEEKGINLSRTSIFRSREIPHKEVVFSSSTARDIVEQIFLHVGAGFVFDYIQTRKPDSDVCALVRPLGFDKLESFGFGSFFITYRNIANNCPLAFWWEQGGWIPLFHRKTNHEGFWF